jgi:hypothetical protein
MPSPRPIVHQVGARRGETEGQECEECAGDRVGPVPGVGREQRRENQQVLQPLVQPQCTQPDTQGGARPFEARLDLRHRTHPFVHVGRRADEHGTARDRPDRQVVPVVAGVVEPLFSERRGQCACLAATLQVGPLVTGDDTLENPQMRADRIGNAMVRGGCEHQGPARGLLLSQPGQELGVIRQRFGLGGGTLRHLRLEVRAARQDPQRQAQHREQVAPQQDEQRFEQRIGAQQATIQVHAQRHGLHAAVPEESRRPRTYRSAIAAAPSTTANQSVAARQTSVSAMAVDNGMPVRTKR